MVQGASANRNASWTTVRRSLDAYAGKTVRLVIEAADGGADSLIEAAIDDLRVYATPGTTERAASYAVFHPRGGAVPV
jgi:hypothetical protein